MLFEEVNSSAAAKSTDTVHCAPLPTYVEAVGITFVDFFSLDVEGAEEFVVETFPLRRSLGFHVVMIESFNRMCKIVCEKREAVRRRMLSMGFRLYPNMVKNSDVFVNASLPQPNCDEEKKSGQLPTNKNSKCYEQRYGSPVHSDSVSVDAGIKPTVEGLTMCEPWNCTCQGFSDTFDTWYYHWGKARNQPIEVRSWWTDHKCDTKPAQNKP
jgi:hypothetical protein